MVVQRPDECLGGPPARLRGMLSEDAKIEHMKRLLKTGLLISLAAIPLKSAATTVVILVTKNGIAMSTDSMTGLGGPNNSITSAIYQDKFVVLQKRIVVAAIGDVGFGSGAHQFDFLKWMETLRGQLPTNATVDDVTNAIEKGSATAFKEFNIASYIEQGIITNENASQPCETFTRFVIAGYQDGSPRIYSVLFDVDWAERKLTGPTRMQMLQALRPYQLGAVQFGHKDAFVDYLNPSSYAHAVIMSICPQVLKKLEAHTSIPSLGDTVALSRALVQVEENTNPNSVGGPIKSLEIVPGGKAVVLEAAR